MPERVGYPVTMEPPKFERCSINAHFSKVNDLRLKSAPARQGGRTTGPSGEAPRGGPATFRLPADHTQLGRAVLFCSLSQLAKPVLRSVSGQRRRFDASPATSGLPQSTDIARPVRLVRFVPTVLKNSKIAGLRKSRKR